MATIKQNTIELYGYLTSLQKALLSSIVLISILHIQVYGILTISLIYLGYFLSVVGVTLYTNSKSSHVCVMCWSGKVFYALMTYSIVLLLSAQYFAVGAILVSVTIWVLGIYILGQIAHTPKPVSFETLDRYASILITTSLTILLTFMTCCSFILSSGWEISTKNRTQFITTDSFSCISPFSLIKPVRYVGK